MKLDWLHISILLCASLTLDSTIILSTCNLSQSSITCFIAIHLQQYWPSDRNNITFSTLENKWPLNNLNFLPLNISNPMIPNKEKVNLQIVYNFNLHVHFMTCSSETCSCLAIAPTPLICFNARLDTNIYNFVCWHIINNTANVTYNEIIASDKQENIYCIINFLKKS